MLTLTNFKHIAAAVLDKVVTLAIKLIPVFSGSYVSYSVEQAQHKSWGDAWATEASYFLQLGGFEAILDKRIPTAA